MHAKRNFCRIEISMVNNAIWRLQFKLVMHLSFCFIFWEKTCEIYEVKSLNVGNKNISAVLSLNGGNENISAVLWISPFLPIDLNCSRQMALFTIGISIRQKFLFAFSFVRRNACSYVDLTYTLVEKAFKLFWSKNFKFAQWAQNSQISYDKNICQHKTHENFLFLHM